MKTESRRREERKKVFHFLEDATHTWKNRQFLHCWVHFIERFVAGNRRLHNASKLHFSLQANAHNIFVFHFETHTMKTMNKITTATVYPSSKSYRFNVYCTFSCLDIVCDKSVNAALVTQVSSFLAHLIIIMHTASIFLRNLSHLAFTPSIAFIGRRDDKERERENMREREEEQSQRANAHGMAMHWPNVRSCQIKLQIHGSLFVSSFILVVVPACTLMYASVRFLVLFHRKIN